MKLIYILLLMYFQPVSASNDYLTTCLKNGAQYDIYTDPLNESLGLGIRSSDFKFTEISQVEVIYYGSQFRIKLPDHWSKIDFDQSDCESVPKNIQSNIKEEAWIKSCLYFIPDGFPAPQSYGDIISGINSYAIQPILAEYLCVRNTTPPRKVCDEIIFPQTRYEINKKDCFPQI